jgi:predicted ATPase with chaperone activity
MEIHARAAVKRSDMSPIARVYVHAVLLNDPVKRWNRRVLRRLAGRREPLELNSWEATDAICSRHVRVVYLMSFQPAKEDNPCRECTQLMTILQQNPEQYPEAAQRIAQEVQEREWEMQQRKNAQQERESKRRKAKRFLEGVADEIDDEEEPPLDLMELLKRDRDDPDASHTA